MKQLVRVAHGYYRPYFYWMFPILVANEEKDFESSGIKLEVRDIVGGGQPEDKADWYKKAFENRSRDFYFCCAWQGVYSTSETGRGKIGAALKSTLIKTFGIYTRPDSGVKSILDLVEESVPIAVNRNADAHYVTLKNLAEFVPEERIKLAHLGGVELCFKGLLDRKVEAATLAGPYAEAAEAIGFRKLLPLSRTEPTVIVFNEDLGRDVVTNFLAAINKGVGRIDADREKYGERYRREFEEVVRQYLPGIAARLPEIRPKVTLPVWAEAKELSRAEFAQIHTFLMQHGLSEEGKGYEETVTPVASPPS